MSDVSRDYLRHSTYHCNIAIVLHNIQAMKKVLLCTATLFIANVSASFTQVIVGQVNVNETANDVLLHSDNAFIISGSEGNSGALFKVTCEGRMLARFAKSYSPGPTVLYEAIELPDGSIVAAGETRVVINDTARPHLVLLRMTPDLKEMTSRALLIAGKGTRGRSLALASNGDVLVLGDTEGVGPDLWDTFLWRMRSSDLTPISAPVLYTYGVDYTHRLTPMGNGEYLIAMAALVGNLLNPDASVQNRLVTLKINEQGQLLWEHIYQYSRQAKYGFCQPGGTVQGFPPALNNIVVCSALHTPASPDSLTDAVFFLLSSSGQPLDTLVLPLPGRQELAGVATSEAQPGLFLAVGRTVPAGGPATIHAAGLVAFNDQLLPAFTINETALPIALHDIQEVPYGRFALLGTLPGLFFLSMRDIILLTPGVEDVKLRYQNCTFSASFSVPDPQYQWYRDSLPIAGAIQGSYKPTRAGNYYVKITDAFGCSGFSDSLYLSWPKADFTWSAAGGTISFTNTSSDAATYLWDFGDGATSTQPNPTHTYVMSGQYVVTLIARDACGTDTIRQIIGVVSTAEAAGGGFSVGVVPNPNTGAFTLVLNGDVQGEVLYALLGADGRLLDRQVLQAASGGVQQVFSYAHLSPGLYTILTQTPKAVWAVRIKIE